MVEVTSNLDTCFLHGNSLCPVASSVWKRQHLQVTSVVDPKLNFFFFPDPDPTLTLILDPDLECEKYI
jgi:hypothetical protein